MNDNIDNVEFDEEKESLTELYSLLREEANSFDGAYIPNPKNMKKFAEAIKNIKYLVEVCGGEIIKISKHPKDIHGRVTAYVPMIDLVKDDISSLMKTLAGLDVFCVTPVFSDETAGLLIEVNVGYIWAAIPKED